MYAFLSKYLKDILALISFHNEIRYLARIWITKMEQVNQFVSSMSQQTLSRNDFFPVFKNIFIINIK